jgi:hypothetical protein
VKTLYAWAKDAAGNISSPLNGVITITTPVTGNIYYLSPNGNDSTGDGSINNPWLTLRKAYLAVKAGDTIYMRGGDYNYTTEQVLYNGQNGSANNYIKIWNYPGENPHIKFNVPETAKDYHAGIVFKGNYFWFKGIEISGFTQLPSSAGVNSGFRMYEGSYNIFENLNIHHNGQGMTLSGSNSTVMNENLVKNSDFHHNYDPYSPIPGGNGGGLSMGNCTGGISNKIVGSRFYWNSDNGVDTWRHEGFVEIDNSWSFNNGYKPGINEGDLDQFIPTGNGVGFKLGTQNTDHGNATLRIIKNSVAYNNGGDAGSGFDQNGLKSAIEAYNNIAYKNALTSDWGSGFRMDDVPYSHILKNNISYQNRNQISLTTQTIHNHNSWDSPVTVTDADFVSINPAGIDGARKADGSLPDVNFLHLAPGSDLINAGVNVGLPYNGSAPDLGAFESSY